MWTAFPPSPVGRYSHDYYEACVTVELALLRTCWESDSACLRD